MIISLFPTPFDHFRFHPTLALDCVTTIIIILFLRKDNDGARAIRLTHAAGNVSSIPSYCVFVISIVAIIITIATITTSANITTIANSAIINTIATITINNSIVTI